MTQTWFTADQHFGHRDIIRSCNRPFADVEEMNETLIANWNARIDRQDRVFCVGDLAYRLEERALASIFRRLNGHKHLIVGNHDDNVTKRLPWASVNQMVQTKVDGDKLFLCHYAMRTWNAARYGTIHLFGHSHGELAGTHNSLDVGVDVWDMAPVNLAEIKLRLAETPAPDYEEDRNEGPRF